MLKKIKTKSFLVMTLFITLFMLLSLHTAYCYTSSKPAMSFLIKNDHYKRQAISITDKIASGNSKPEEQEGLACANEIARAFEGSLGFSETQYLRAETSKEELFLLAADIYRCYLGLLVNQKTEKRDKLKGKDTHPMIIQTNKLFKKSLDDSQRKLDTILSRLRRQTFNCYIRL